MNRNTPHRITICTSCKDKTTGHRPGAELISTLRAALAEQGDVDAYSVTGAACMAGCDRPCTVAFHGQGKASYLFGDIAREDADRDIADLVEFARSYALLADGWCSSVDRPGRLRKSTLARIPATLFVAPQPAEVSA